VLSEAIPSMFRRRLLLLAAAGVVGLSGVSLRTAVLGTGRHDELRARAESKLVVRRMTPTTRGRILDRTGRVLAEDRPSSGLAVTFPAVSGQWPARRAREMAPRLFRGDWAEWDKDRRASEVENLTAVYERHLIEAWRRLGTLVGASTREIEERRADIVRLVQSRFEAVQRSRRARALALAEESGEPLSETQLREIERRAGEPIADQSAAHVILPMLPDALALEIDRYLGATTDLVVRPAAGSTREIVDRVEVIPGLRVVASGERLYPLEVMTVDIDTASLPAPLRSGGLRRVEATGVGVHVIGWTRSNVRDSDIERRGDALAANADLREESLTEGGADRGGYDESGPELIGAAGIEQSMEFRLRGLRGEHVRRADTGETSRTPAKPGGDVTLTIDAMLQARVQAVMDPSLGLAVVQHWNASPEKNNDGTPNPAFRPVGTPLHGAAVVMDVDSGEILAMVSTPGFTRSELSVEGSKVFEPTAEAGGGAFLNRAVGRPYPPGSVAKALMLVGAAERGVYKTGDAIECTGHLFPKEPNAFRCWIFKRTQFSGSPVTHQSQFGHPLSGAEALMVSCNVFFFTIGQRLGIEGVQSVYREFGVGQSWGLGVGGEFSGIVGRPERLGKMQIQDAIQMGIGQGPVAWTPLHAAQAYATIARFGAWVHPKIVIGHPTREVKKLAFPGEAAVEALEGLGYSVRDQRGSGHHIVVNGESEPVFDIPVNRLWLWGKTGTAAGSDTFDPDGPSGPALPETVSGDHSWYVVLAGSAQDRRPRYAISVLMEYAGSGGKVSGPICNQIVHALIAEGYLRLPTGGEP